jgi:hypothetical protein
MYSLQGSFTAGSRHLLFFFSLPGRFFFCALLRGGGSVCLLTVDVVVAPRFFIFCFSYRCVPRYPPPFSSVPSLKKGERVHTTPLLWTLAVVLMAVLRAISVQPGTCIGFFSLCCCSFSAGVGCFVRFLCCSVLYSRVFSRVVCVSCFPRVAHIS